MNTIIEIRYFMVCFTLKLGVFEKFYNISAHIFTKSNEDSSTNNLQSN